VDAKYYISQMPLILYYTLIRDHGVGGGSALLVRVIVPKSWALPPWGVCGRGRKDVCGDVWRFWMFVEVVLVQICVCVCVRMCVCVCRGGGGGDW